MIYPFYYAEITDTASGITRLYRNEMTWDTGTDDAFWWEQGNMSCDCNRGMLFMDCIPVTRELKDYEFPCGKLRFKVKRLIFPDGTERKIDE